MPLEIPQQLNCPICMSIFQNPITTECGHSFCRNCLISSAKTKKVCPICRQEFSSSPQKLKEDDTLSQILSDFRSISILKKHQATSFQSKSQIMLLLDVKTSELILPFNKVTVTFELQNPVLLNIFQKFVAKQQIPFDKYGVIVKIHDLNKLRHNLYECKVEGKSFCVIQNDTIHQGNLQSQEQYFYRTCNAKEIIETSILNPKKIQPFLQKLQQIKNIDLLHKIQAKTNLCILTKGTDPLSMIYSIFGLLDISNQQKYQVLTLFNQQKRMQVINKIIQKVKDQDVSQNVKGFLNVRTQSSLSFKSVLIFIVLFGFILWINIENPSQL